MFYTIYKITNLIDGSIYIGKHQTQNLSDGYMGSGKHLKRAISKHGIENFKKEILFYASSEDEMNAKEAELVTEEFCARDDTYNLCPGGQGGWGYVNTLSIEPKRMGGKARAASVNMSVLGSVGGKNRFLKNPSINTELYTRYGKVPSTKGLKFSEETKLKMSESNSGNNNSQFGTMWITDGSKSIKVKKDTQIPDGWYKGRVQKRGCHVAYA